jgi:TetR/AcrR family transcriptional regulator, transcriptional repressor for nem operon
MGRASRTQQQLHRERILDVAARQVKTHGLDGVTIPEIMGAAGLTPGGFYGHFTSKSDLSAQAVERAFDVQAATLAMMGEDNVGDHDAAVGALVDFYFSDVHRTQLERSCPMAALGVDVAREPTDSAARAAYVEGITRNLGQLAGLGDPPDADVSPEQRAEALVTMATAIGAIVMARATAGAPISDEIVGAVRAALNGENQ